MHMHLPEQETKDALQTTSSFLKWIYIAICTGFFGGIVGICFHKSVDYATELRVEDPRLLWLLPIAGIVIVAFYHLTHQERGNTNAIIDSIHFGQKVPLLLLPAIYLGTFLTHLCGGSAGREGAALQIGGSIGWCVGQIFILDDKDMRIATLSGMSAVFSALFGTPVTAAIFALEVISVGIVYYSGLIPCLISALIAFWLSELFGVIPTHFNIMIQPMGDLVFIKVVLLALFCCLLSVVFCHVLHKTEHFLAAFLKNSYLRIVVGAFIIIGLTYAVGCRDYNGAGMDIIRNAIEHGRAKPLAFFFKLIFTAITIGCGFKGGEVVPSFFIGATFGCVMGPLLGLSPGFSAAIGLICVFCGAVNCPIASLILSIELFGSTYLIFFAIACGISYTLSGYTGLYSSQKIVYSKIKAEFIDIYAK